MRWESVKTEPVSLSKPLNSLIPETFSWKEKELKYELLWETAHLLTEDGYLEGTLNFYEYLNFKDWNVVQTE